MKRSPADSLSEADRRRLREAKLAAAAPAITAAAAAAVRTVRSAAGTQTAPTFISVHDVVASYTEHLDDDGDFPVMASTCGFPGTAVDAMDAAVSAAAAQYAHQQHAVHPPPQQQSDRQLQQSLESTAVGMKDALMVGAAG